MDPVASAFGRFVAELKRRHVLRVLVGYGAALWLLIQIGEATFDPLGVPESALTVLVVIGVLGFPLAGVLAWFLPVGQIPAVPTDPTPEPDPDAGGPRPVVVDNLPAPPTPLVGRERELADAERMIVEEGCRLLTITGPAGVGKTRLGLELGRRLAPHFPNGVCYAPAASLHAPEGLPFLLAERLGVGFAPGEDPWAATVGYVRGKRMLVLVDNFEQITAGSGLLSELVATGPGIVVVVTSRARLGLKAESALQLQGLPYPEESAADLDADAYPAVRLFVQSARRVDRSFELAPEVRDHVAHICRVVEGLPLALELAAGGVGVLSPAEIARELESHHDLPLASPRDAPSRHRSLRAAFESSWALLDPAEERAFRRLTVFRGGFTRRAAEEVAGASVPLLAALLNKSLLRRHELGRFDMLESIRQLGEEKLEADPAESATARELHAEHCTVLLEELVRRSGRGEDRLALSEVVADAENVRAAWEWLYQRRDMARLDRASEGLYRFWEARGWIAEGRELFRRARVAVAESDEEVGGTTRGSALLARLLAREGAFAELGGAHEEARTLLDEARSLLRPESQPRELAMVLCSLSFATRAAGEFERARELALESLDLYRSLGDRTGAATALNSLGAQCYLLGRYQEAKEHYREAVALFRESGDSHGLWKPLNNLAGVALIENDYGEARRLLEETLEHQRRAHNRFGEAYALENLGLVEHQAGEHEAAERLLEEAIGISEDGGYMTLLAHALNTLGAVRIARSDNAGALAAYRRALETASEVGDLPLALTVLMGVARAHAGRGQVAAAIRIAAVVRTHRACDGETRRQADTLLAELGEEAGAGVAPGETQLDIDDLRDLGMRTLVSAD